MRYTSVLSDGDATTIAHPNEIKTYGDDMIIIKEECVNHVGKRLGTALRNLVKEEKARGVTLEGKKAGALKDTAIGIHCPPTE
ncbi:Autophagy-related protein 11 [Frankliniella fusca]|uniref:Autophagy-related protein 11 n=1 Tax=Frankliniella fusca TaxID=407009 RepID=A0AAE1GYZ2_9NEOP|nr:Autophagy-related protein 11 [Frankliniella fusca]